MKLNDEHLEKLSKIKSSLTSIHEEPGSRSGFDWVSGLKLSTAINFPDIEHYQEPLDRRSLFDLASKKCVDTKTLCAIILAWGGMRFDNGRRLFAEENSEWLETADRVRTAEMTRSEAYKAFYSLRKKDKLNGMGPAFFTKLVFFLRGKKDCDIGYIMDQWVGCSINLLCQPNPPVLMDAIYKADKDAKIKKAFSVSEHNDSARYEDFCSALDQVAKVLSLSGIEAELLLMSSGRGRGPWRNYVIQKRRLPGLELSESTNDESGN